MLPELVRLIGPALRYFNITSKVDVTSGITNKGTDSASRRLAESVLNPSLISPKENKLRAGDVLDLSKDKEAASTTTGSNDNLSAFENTMERIMQRHNLNGQVTHYHNDNFDKEKIYQKTIESIMSLHNLHEKEYTSNSADNDNKRTRRTREQVSNDLLRKIERHTRNTDKGIQKLIGFFDSEGIDSLRAKEREIEAGNGYNHDIHVNGSSMDPEGKIDGPSLDKEKKKKPGLSEIKTGLILGGVGLVTKAIGWLAGSEDNDVAEKKAEKDAAGGVSEKQQKPQEKAENRKGSKSPEPMPKADRKPQQSPKKVKTVEKPTIDKRPAGSQVESKGVGYVPATAIPTKVRADKEFQAEVTRVSKKYNMAEDDLYRVIGFESAGTYSPSIKNPRSSATGLIQFMTDQKTPHWATKKGYTRESLSKMSRTEQMKIVDEYFEDNGLGAVRNPDISDAYMTIFSPAAVKKPNEHVLFKQGQSAYKANREFDTNQDGKFTKEEAVAKVKDTNISGVGRYKAPKTSNALNIASNTQLPILGGLGFNASGPIIKLLEEIRENTKEKPKSSTPAPKPVERPNIKAERLSHNSKEQKTVQQTITVDGRTYNVHQANKEVVAKYEKSNRRPPRSSGFLDMLKDYF